MESLPPKCWSSLSSCRYHMSLNATLQIFSVQDGDEGSYQCVARNDQDEAQDVGFLSLGGKKVC